MDADNFADQSRRRRSNLMEDDIEEGEFVAGSDDTHYMFQDHRDGVQGAGRPEINRRRLVVSEPVMDPMPIAFASSRVESNPPIKDDSMAIASSSNPTNQVGVHPFCSSQFHEGHQPAVPPVVVVKPQPAVAGQGQLAAAPPKIVTDLQLAPYPVQSAALLARDEEGWWICKEEGCDKRYATHQGLGGHMAGHKNRENNVAAAAGLHLGVGGASCAKPAKLHPCKHCPKVFTSGVQLGGHMRKHYEGKMISKKRGAGAKVSAGELASALQALSLPMAPAAMEAAAPVPEVAADAMEAAAPVPELAPASVVLRIFGFNIVTVPPSPP